MADATSKGDEKEKPVDIIRRWLKEGKELLAQIDTENNSYRQILHLLCETNKNHQNTLSQFNQVIIIQGVMKVRLW